MIRILILALSLPLPQYSFAGDISIQSLSCEKTVYDKSHKQFIELDGQKLTLSEAWIGILQDTQDYQLFSTELDGETLTIKGRKYTVFEVWDKMTIVVNLATGQTELAQIQHMFTGVPKGKPQNMGTYSCSVNLDL